MANTIHVDIVSAEGQIFKGDADHGVRAGRGRRDRHCAPACTAADDAQAGRGARAGRGPGGAVLLRRGRRPRGPAQCRVGARRYGRQGPRPGRGRRAGGQAARRGGHARPGRQDRDCGGAGGTGACRGTIAGDRAHYARNVDRRPITGSSRAAFRRHSRCGPRQADEFRPAQGVAAAGRGTSVAARGAHRARTRARPPSSSSTATAASKSRRRLPTAATSSGCCRPSNWGPAMPSCRPCPAYPTITRCSCCTATCR